MAKTLNTYEMLSARHTGSLRPLELCTCAGQVQPRLPRISDAVRPQNAETVIMAQSLSQRGSSLAEMIAPLHRHMKVWSGPDAVELKQVSTLHRLVARYQSLEGSIRLTICIAAAMVNSVLYYYGLQ